MTNSKEKMGESGARDLSSTAASSCGGGRTCTHKEKNEKLHRWELGTAVASFYFGLPLVHISASKRKRGS